MIFLSEAVRDEFYQSHFEANLFISSGTAICPEEKLTVNFNAYVRRTDFWTIQSFLCEKNCMKVPETDVARLMMSMWMHFEYEKYKILWQLKTVWRSNWRHLSRFHETCCWAAVPKYCASSVNKHTHWTQAQEKTKIFILVLVRSEGSLIFPPALINTNPPTSTRCAVLILLLSVPFPVSIKKFRWLALLYYAMMRTRWNYYIWIHRITQYREDFYLTTLDRY